MSSGSRGGACAGAKAAGGADNGILGQWVTLMLE